jgi:hypothetical protein
MQWPRGAWPARAATARSGLTTFLTALACTGVLAWVQLSFDGLYDGDSYFHTRAAEQLVSQGVRIDFPQAAFSTWRDGYSDKDLAFHALLGIDCRNADLTTCGKRGAILLDGLLFLSLATVISVLGLRFGPLWLVLILTSHAWFFEHLLSVRPALLAMALFPLELAALLKGRNLLLTGLSAFHVLAHSTFVLLPALPVALGGAQLVRGGPFPWKSLAATVGGVAAATALHPQLPNNVTLAFDQIFEVARNAWGPGVTIPPDLFGSELRGLPIPVLLAAFPLWLPTLSGIVAVGATGWDRLSTRSLCLLAVAAGFGVLTLLSMRFLEFLAPLAGLSAASIWTDATDDRAIRLAPSIRWGGAAVLASCLIWGQLRAPVWRVAAQVERYRSPASYRAAIEHLDEIAAPEDQVYHSFWWAFSWLYHYRPEGRYIAGLDPVFLYRFDEALFGRMLRAHRGAGNVYATVSRDFGARWVFLEKLPRTERLRKRLREDPRFVRRYRDRYAEVYEALPEADPPGAAPSGKRTRPEAD